MKISIISDKPIQKYQLQALDYETHDFPLDKEFELAPGWYELQIAYVDTKIEIQDIKINDSSLREFLYTGYYTDGSGKIHQPACAVWDEGGVFSIWLHTEIGILFTRLIESIKSGEYGKNLFENHLLTVDRPLLIKDTWPAEMTSFFKSAHGPYWWQKNTDTTPWIRRPIPPVDVDLLLKELDKVCTHDFVPEKGRLNKSLKPKGPNGDCRYCDLPFVELQDIKSEIVRDFVSSIGYKRVIDISVQSLGPGQYIAMHNDERHREGDAYMRGCQMFYWTCKNPDDVHFKLGRAGVLPHEPLLVNNVVHTHAVVNEGTQTKTSILIYGEL
jgi:hypothetical protein